jgi:hypothetical protein
MKKKKHIRKRKKKEKTKKKQKREINDELGQPERPIPRMGSVA